MHHEMLDLKCLNKDKIMKIFIVSCVFFKFFYKTSVLVTTGCCLLDTDVLLQLDSCLKVTRDTDITQKNPFSH